MPPSSGELWGHHLMPSQVQVDFLLPNGILITMQCPRDATLGILKMNLWKEARKHPLFYMLADPVRYIFCGITQDAQREEYFDETRRLCDLRLFMTILKIVEPVGNKDEGLMNTALGLCAHLNVLFVCRWLSLMHQIDKCLQHNYRMNRIFVLLFQVSDQWAIN